MGKIHNDIESLKMKVNISEEGVKQLLDNLKFFQGQIEFLLHALLANGIIVLGKDKEGKVQYLVRRAIMLDKQPDNSYKAVRFSEEPLYLPKLGEELNLMPKENKLKEKPAEIKLP